MALINSWLKSIFTVFNILFVIFGGILIGLALVGDVVINIYEGIHGEESRETVFFAVLLVYFIGAITMVIAILGVYGALREKKWALVMFLVFMVLGSLLMFRAGAFHTINRPQVKNVLEDSLRRAVPLDNSPEQLQNAIDQVQKEFHCCGLFSYRDWNQLPNSCMCDQEDVQEGKCRRVSYPYFMQSQYIYTKTCYPIFEQYVLLGLDIVVGVAFTMGSFALLGMILSSIMIHHIRYPNRSTIMLTVPTVFTAQPPKYEELHNAPPY